MESTPKEQDMTAKLEREYVRVSRLLEAAQNRASDGAGCYSESYAQADARQRRSEATIRKHRRALASIERRLKG